MSLADPNAVKSPNSKYSVSQPEGPYIMGSDRIIKISFPGIFLYSILRVTPKSKMYVADFNSTTSCKKGGRTVLFNLTGKHFIE
mgnify:CR=1 FL=1